MRMTQILDNLAKEMGAPDTPKQIKSTMVRQKSLSLIKLKDEALSSGRRQSFDESTHIQDAGVFPLFTVDNLYTEEISKSSQDQNRQSMTPKDFTEITRGDYKDTTKNEDFNKNWINRNESFNRESNQRQYDNVTPTPSLATERTESELGSRCATPTARSTRIPNQPTKHAWGAFTTHIANISCDSMHFQMKPTNSKGSRVLRDIMSELSPSQNNYRRDYNNNMRAYEAGKYMNVNQERKYGLGQSQRVSTLRGQSKHVASNFDSTRHELDNRPISGAANQRYQSTPIDHVRPVYEPRDRANSGAKQLKENLSNEQNNRPNSKTRLQSKRRDSTPKPKPKEDKAESQVDFETIPYPFRLSVEVRVSN